MKAPSSFCGIIKLSLLVFLAVFFLRAAAQDQKPQATRDLSDFEQRLTKLNEEIKTLRAKIKAEEKKESTLLSTLDRIAFTIKITRNELALYNVQHEKTSQELAAVRKNIAQLRGKLEREKQSMERTLVTLYKYGRFNFFEVLLRAKNMNTIFIENKSLGILARYQENIISSYLQTLAELKSAEEAQETKRAELAELIQGAAQKKQELEAQEKENRALIRQTQINKRIYEQTLTEKNERAQHLQILMKKLASQEIVLPSPFIPFYEMEGKLPWPIKGRIITRYGKERHPQFNTVTMNNGIEISPSEGESLILSVHAGKVVFADYFQGYGNLLILDHGMNY